MSVITTNLSGAGKDGLFLRVQDPLAIFHPLSWCVVFRFHGFQHGETEGGGVFTNRDVSCLCFCGFHFKQTQRNFPPLRAGE
jgi:hypothetical protein